MLYRTTRVSVTGEHSARFLPNPTPVTETPPAAVRKSLRFALPPIRPYHVSVTSAARLKLGIILLFALAPALPAQSGTGHQIFSSTCAGCHGLDARGGEHGPNIATDARVQRLSDADLLNIIRNGIAKGGMPAFGSSLKPAQLDAVVSYLRSLQGKGGPVVAIAGDAAAGRLLFFGRAECSRCHMVAGEGGFIAPDLSGYGANHQPSEIREQIVDPKKYAKPGRGLATVTAKNGKTFTGVIRNEDNFSLQLQTLDGRFVFLDKRDISRLAAVPEGLMPGDYGSTLNPIELDNLVSYLARMTGRP
jgi:cytochrome c oxidase cbb3-type subunit III